MVGSSTEFAAMPSIEYLGFMKFENALDTLVPPTLLPEGTSWAWSGNVIARELKGISCLELEEMPASKKAIASARSFGHQVESIEEIQHARSPPASPGCALATAPAHRSLAIRHMI